MTDNSTNRDDIPRRSGDETTLFATPWQSLFSDLTQPETLRTAYTRLSEAFAMDLPICESDPPLASDEVSTFLQELVRDLRAGGGGVTHRTTGLAADKVSNTDARTHLRNQIVQIALADALESVFPADPPANPVAWTAAVIGRGLSRVYAMKLEDSEADRSEQILAAVHQRVADPAFLALLGDVLKSIDIKDATGSNPLVSVLTRIAMHNIDQVLHQANLLGRQGSYTHATCIRFDREVAIFLDNDSQYDWLLPAVQKRLREALAEIKAEVDPENTQLVDLARGEMLHFLDHDFCLIKEKNGTPRVQHNSKSLVKTHTPKADALKPRRRTWKLPSLRWPRRGLLRKPVAPTRAQPRRRIHWPTLELHWPRWSWTSSPKVPRRVYAVGAGIIMLGAVMAVSAAVVALRSDGLRLYPVRGQVFYEGEPAVGALVVFLPKDPTDPQAHAASALVAEDGSYVLGTNKAKDGAIAGPYLVTVSMQRRSAPNPLPARYGSRRTTPLTAIVDRGPTEVPMFRLQAETP